MPTVVLTNFNNLTINGGTTTLGASLTAITGTLAVSSGTLNLSTFNIASASAVSLTGTTISGTGTLTLAGDVATNASASTAQITAPIALNGAVRTFNIAAGAATPDLLISSVVSGAGSSGLQKAGSGELSLSGNNTYAGGTSLAAGTLNINSATAIGTGTLGIASGTTLDNGSGGALTLSNNNTQLWNGNWTFTGTQPLNMGTGGITLVSSTQVTTSSANLTIGGIISGANALTKEGSGLMILSASNTFTGGVTINAGTLRLLNAGALNSGTPNALAFGASSTGVLQLYGNNITVSNLNTNVVPGTPSIENGFGGTSTLTINTSGVSSYAGAIADGGAGAVALTKSGAGALSLSGTNTYTAGTTLSAGTLNLNSNDPIGTGLLTISGGVLGNSSGASRTLAQNNPMVWSGDFSFNGPQDLNLGTGGVTLSASRTVTASAGTLVVGGVVTGAFGLQKSGAGVLTLNGSNTFTGGFTLNSGTINLGHANSLGTSAGTLTISGGTINNTSGGSLTVPDYPQVWNSNFTFTGSNPLNLGAGAVSIAADVTANVSASTLTVGGVVSTTNSLTKNGAGTLAFAGNDVTLRNLTINSGTLTAPSSTLFLSGDLSNSGTFIANGGTVHYNGTSSQAVSAVAYNNLTMSGSGQKNAFGTVNVAGNFNNTSVFDLSGYTLSVVGSTNNTNGTLRFNGTSNGLAIATGTVVYYGSSQTVAAGTYENLTITQSTGDAILAGNTTVNGVLTISTGLLNLNGYTLTLGPAAAISIASPSAGRMIIATGTSQVRKVFTATGSFLFPIGDVTGTADYAPVTVNLTAASGFSSAYIGVSVTDSKHPSNSSASNFISRYWNVISSGITAPVVTVTGTYHAGDITGTEASISAAQLNGSFNQVSNPWTKFTALGGSTLTAAGATLTDGQTSVFTGITGANPSVTINGGGVTICAGGSVALSTTAAGDAILTYSWSPSTGLSASTVPDPVASPTVTTLYTVTIRDGNGITATANTTITVNPAPTLTSAALASTVCAGSTGTINLTGLLAGSTSTISYSINGVAQAPVAGVVANGAGNASFSTVVLSAANNGQNISVTGITITSATPNCTGSFSIGTTLNVNSPAAITTQP
ncbi:MAG: autotransporter-associated beta strand repeat-containing protein, partial [Cyclobacteriaceae bacterium]